MKRKHRSEEEASPMKGLLYIVPPVRVGVCISLKLFGTAPYLRQETELHEAAWKFPCSRHQVEPKCRQVVSLLPFAGGVVTLLTLQVAFPSTI